MQFAWEATVGFFDALIVARKIRMQDVDPKAHVLELRKDSPLGFLIEIA